MPLDGRLDFRRFLESGLRWVSAGSFHEQRLVIEPTWMETYMFPHLTDYLSVPDRDLRKNKQTDTHANKQTNKQTNKTKQTNKQSVQIDRTDRQKQNARLIGQIRREIVLILLPNISVTQD